MKKVRVIIFPFILCCFSFVSDAMIFFTHSLSRFLKKLLTCWWFSSIGCPFFGLLNMQIIFFINSTFINSTWVKLAKNQTLRLNFCCLKVIDILHPHYPRIGYILKNKQKNKCACIHKTILIIMKMNLKMKNKLHRHDINRPRSRYGCKYIYWI